MAINKLAGCFLLTFTIIIVFTHFIIIQDDDRTGISRHITTLKQWLPSTSTVEADDKWDNLYVPREEFPETRWVQGVAGFNYFHNLYLSNGTYIVLTSDPEHLPAKGVTAIFSGLSDPEDRWHHRPAAGEDRFMIVSPEEAEERQLFERSAVRKTGVSLMFNDVAEGKLSSFLNHYYHFSKLGFWAAREIRVVLTDSLFILSGEMFLGLWRVVAASGETELPARLIYRANATDWRDHAGITTWFQQAVLAETIVEEVTVYEDRKKSGMTFLFDKIAIADRWAAHRAGQEVKYWNKANADLPLLNVTREWMDPLRNQIKKLVQTEGCEVKRNDPEVPVVVYVNRQLTGRRLVDADAAELLEEMEKLDAEGVIEFHNAFMEKIPRTDQFCLALRSDIMFGVHGNGLSHQLWMKPGSGVMEIMPTTGFARDYAILGEMMGHEYYAIHHNATFPPDQWRKPNGWMVDQGKDFHSNRITVDGKFMAGMVRKMAEERRYVTEPELP
ncbi:hypothetical protein I317_04928 [Kwoniella heveanensis CBS 569]|nr:hypothetical protein I317_04928 [Kwoniella heveanensis CBS 569]